jgi:hypothetical protein
VAQIRILSGYIRTYVRWEGHRTCESDLTRKRNQSFRKFLFLLLQLPLLRLHAAPWHYKAYALSTHIHCLAIREVRCCLHHVLLRVFLAV